MRAGAGVEFEIGAFAGGSTRTRLRREDKPNRRPPGASYSPLTNQPTASNLNIFHDKQANKQVAACSSFRRIQIDVAETTARSVSEEKRFERKSHTRNSRPFASSSSEQLFLPDKLASERKKNITRGDKRDANWRKCRNFAKLMAGTSRPVDWREQEQKQEDADHKPQAKSPTSQLITMRTGAIMKRDDTHLAAIFCWLSPLLLLLLLAAGCRALQMINLDVPQFAPQGDTIQLTCAYRLAAPGERELETTNQSAAGTSSLFPELLYAVKWYRDEQEFYRYLAQEWPHHEALPRDGLNVDLKRSDNQTVTLRNITLRTSGAFKCEVSTDAPFFITKSIERKMFVYSLPSRGPVLSSNLRLSSPSTFHLVYLAEQLAFQCWSHESKPHAQLDWIINDSINLSSSVPLKPDGVPLFRLEQKRFIRLKNQSTPALAPARQTAANILHELDTNKLPKLVARPLGGATAAALALTESTLTKLHESTFSTLNFTVDDDLLRLLAESASQIRSSGRSRWLSSASMSHGSSSNRKAKDKLTAMKIKCQARVMHIGMSDEIKLSLVNATRKSGSNSAIRAMSMKSYNLQLKTMQNSSSARRKFLYAHDVILSVPLALMISLSINGQIYYKSEKL